MAPPGWYSDPVQRHANRYWSGDGWSRHVADGDVVGADPLDGDTLDGHIMDGHIMDGEIMDGEIMDGHALAELAPPDPTASGFPYAEGPGGYRVGPCDPGLPLITMLVQTSGTLQLAFGHLRFVTPRGSVVFDVPLSELHSLGVGELGTAIDVWHGDERHRVSLAGAPEIMVPPMVASVPVAGPAVGAVAVTSGVRQFRREKETTRAWRELLEPYIAAEAPPGVKVRRPMGNVAYATSVMLLVILTTALIFAGVVAAALL